LAGTSEEQADLQGKDAPAADSFNPTESSDIMIERGTMDQLEAKVAEIQAALASGDIPKSCARPDNWESDEILADMGWGFWPIQDSQCRDWGTCPDGTFAYQISLKSVADQGSGDDPAVTGIALGCNDPVTGAFLEWAVPIWASTAPGSWDNSAVCPNAAYPLWGGNFALVAGPTSADDVGITDGAVVCSNGTTLQVNVNNPTWGSWQGWEYCPSGTRFCAVTQRETDALAGNNDNAGISGVKVSCCEQ